MKNYNIVVFALALIILVAMLPLIALVALTEPGDYYESRDLRRRRV